MDNTHTLACQTCGYVGLPDASDGYFYCSRCHSQAEDIIETDVADEDFVDKGGDTGGAIYLASHRRQRSQAIKAEPISQYNSFYESQSQLLKTLGLEDETPQHGDNCHEGPIKVEESYDPQFDGVGSSHPGDFGGSSGMNIPSFEDYYNEIRMRYVMGLQMMIEFQCEALVKEFKVTPLICGLIGPIWLRFVSDTGVFDDDWADEVIHESEMKHEGEPADHKPRAKYCAEPHNMYGQRAVMIWYRSLRKKISLACTVAVSFLACHIAREAVLTTDIMKWTLEGKLPYFSAFLEIENAMGKPSSACPISSSVMFRPSQAVPLQKLESLAASIAQSIGMELPPVNFYAIAYRYLRELSLPVEKILPHACCINEWAMPPNLWLSTNDLKLPTRVCVMSILIVAIRILYNINGFGEWERSLSHNGGDSVKSSSGSVGKKIDGMDTAFASHDRHDVGKNSGEDPLQPQNPELDAATLLQHLHAKYNEIAETYDYSKDLTTHLHYCKDVVFAGLEPSFENHEEENMIEFLWNNYQNEKDAKPAELVEKSGNPLNQKRSADKGCNSGISKEKKKRADCIDQPSPDDASCVASDVHATTYFDSSSEILRDFEESETSEHTSSENHVNEAIRQMKLDMEEKRFYYMPPRVNLKRFDYLHYVRKKDKGALTYVAHADYYILLRGCARIAQVDIRIMHISVLSLERRLAWLENRIDKSLHVKPPIISCQFCSNMTSENVTADVPDEILNRSI